MHVLHFINMFLASSLWEILLLLPALVCCLPLVPVKEVRYYGCYLLYTASVIIVSLFLTPLFLLRPRDTLNSWFAANILKHFTKPIGIQWELRNGHILENKECGGSVVVMNHQSIFDILGMFNFWNKLGRTTTIVKRPLLYVPFFGLASWLGGCIFIDRSNSSGANEQLLEAASSLKNKIHLCIFPEGTRNKKGGALLPFKRGAFKVAIKCQAPIIPVVYSPYYFIDSKNKDFSQGRVIVSVLEPIQTNGLTEKDIDFLKDKTHKVMSDEYHSLQIEAEKFRHSTPIY